MSHASDLRTDADLLAASSRDAAAFRVLYDRHAVTIHAFARRRCGDEDAALDLTAETFARAWFGRRRFRDHRGGSALPWLYGIAGNVVRESARRHRMADDAVRRLGLALASDGAALEPDTTWVDGLDEDLEAALAALPDQQRTAVLRRVVDDESYEELASDLACSSGAARVRVSRGLTQLRRAMERGSDG